MKDLLSNLFLSELSRIFLEDQSIKGKEGLSVFLLAIYLATSQILDEKVYNLQVTIPTPLVAAQHVLLDIFAPAYRSILGASNIRVTFLHVVKNSALICDELEKTRSAV